MGNRITALPTMGTLPCVSFMPVGAGIATRARGPDVSPRDSGGTPPRVFAVEVYPAYELRRL